MTPAEPTGATQSSRVTWPTPDCVEVGGVRFLAEGLVTPAVDLFPIHKPRELLRDFVETMASLAPQRVVELGTSTGASAALLALLTDPIKLVTIDLSDLPRPAFDEWARAFDMDDRVRRLAGMDQADRGAMAAMMDREFAGAPLDVVIDDASHALESTRACFEQLFPHLRPGGRYFIEDWNWEQKFHDFLASIPPDATPPEGVTGESLMLELAARAYDPLVTPGPDGRLRTPLLRLGFELVLACARGGEAITDVRFSPWWLEIERGPATLDPSTFRLGNVAADSFGLLAD